MRLVRGIGGAVCTRQPPNVEIYSRKKKKKYSFLGFVLFQGYIEISKESLFTICTTFHKNNHSYDRKNRRQRCGQTMEEENVCTRVSKDARSTRAKLNQT